MKSIEIINVSKTFGSQLVLNNINVNFENGKIHGIIGRNGSGKTVLLKCICGLMHPDTGNIMIDGNKLGRSNTSGNIGAIIESPGFLPNYSGFKNLMFLAGIRKIISKDEIIKSMQVVGLDANLKKHVTHYSMGMRQRLGLAQAIMENPDILILDEPMNGLDQKGVKEIRNLLLSLRDDGKTILIASHSKEDVDILCDTVHIMDAGMLITER